jgi:hypothetical protein
MRKVKPKSARLVALELEWQKRFGEPTPITASAALLARILRETKSPEPSA